MIEIKKLHKSFGGRKVLDGVDLKIPEGRTLVIIGRSGCGKSVLLKHIIGLLKPDSGGVFVDGADISRLKEEELERIRRSIEMVFQGGALFDSLTVGENVGFRYLEHGGMEKGALKERVRESLALVGLYSIEEMLPSELSGGMKKRVAVARAICTGPRIILYDEPTTGVDPITADSINGLIRSLHDRLKVTSIVVTHDMKSAYSIADRIAMLYEGKIIAEGTPADIQHSADPVVQQFINGLSTGPITDTSSVHSGAK
ncbi:MAG: ABC transporter ATP-binding protein [Candidatus Omnitrophota bacterium]|jgi:phospholipid/cholesterol/gamma-HCH transport system ATP-binding protein